MGPINFIKAVPCIYKSEPVHIANTRKTTAEQLRSDLRFRGSELRRAESLVDVKRVFEEMQVKTGLDALSSIETQHRMISRLQKKREIDIRRNGELGKLANTYDLLGQEPVCGDSACSSFILGFKDIQNFVEKRDLKHFTACGFGAVFADSHIEAAGLTLALFSPVWKMGPKTISSINLSGGDALNPENRAPNNTPGQPGESGQSGGNFYGMADHIMVGLEKERHSLPLEISVNGGRGGNGQKGGNGSDGRPGEDGSLGEVYAAKEDFSQSRLLPNFSWFIGDTKKTSDVIRGERGTEGKDACKGGVRGFGGKHGSAEIVDLHTKLYPLTYKYHKHDGSDGLDGQPGDPGKGGKNGMIFKGDWGNFSIKPWRCLGTGIACVIGIEYVTQKLGIENNKVFDLGVGIAPTVIAKLKNKEGWISPPKRIPMPEFADSGKEVPIHDTGKKAVHGVPYPVERNVFDSYEKEFHGRVADRLWKEWLLKNLSE